MKKLLLTTTFLCMTGVAPAIAQTTTAIGTGVSEANSQSGSLAVANNRGNGNSQSSLTINNPANTTATVNSRASGTTTVRTAPSMVAPGLAAAGLETCLGSASGTVSAIGFGIGGGSTYADEGCQARLDSRTLYAYGLKAAAVARLCQRVDIWRSMPDMCQQYWPQGVPYPAGVVVAAPGVAITMSTDSARSGIVRVIDGRDGVEKDCLNYNAPAQKCTHWLGEAPRRRTAAVNPTHTPPRIGPKARSKETPPSAVAKPPEAPATPEAPKT